MKILHIIEALGGGIHTYFKELSYFFNQEDISKKHQTIIVYNDKRDEIIPEKIKNDFGDKITLLKLDMVKEINPIKDLSTTFKLAKIIREEKPDVVHLHSSKASIIGRWASCASLHQHKLFYTPHGYSFLREDVSPLKRKLFKNIEKYTQVIFGGTTIACGDTEFKIAKTLGKAELVRNGINVKQIEKNYLPTQNDRLTFGIIGRITAQKNPKLFNQIALQFPQYNFIWIGDGELNHEITAPNITITGWFFNAQEVYQHLNKIDVFLQTSLWEGLPIALLEALTFKKPIVSTNVIGNKDIVEHGINGFLFDDISELNSHFKQLENEDFRLNMGENAYKTCTEKFNSLTNFNQLLAIYSR